ncbi:MAG: FAD-dependent monooxygenase [Acetobacteraceae bacterium]|nr:FAD-dependent monooxygenase [Acetobacteraceae bacterium]
MATDTAPQEQTHETEVAIIGCGPAGATLANLLGVCGVSVLLLEREGAVYPLPRAVHFDDEVMRVIQTTGLVEPILPHTRVSPGMRFVDAQGRLLLDWSRPMEVGPQGWNASYRFHQPDLERILREGAEAKPSVKILLRSEVFAIRQDNEGAQVEYEDLPAAPSNPAGPDTWWAAMARAPWYGV